MTKESKRHRVAVAILCLAVVLSIPASATIIINEIAWGGTAASASDEWIELYNTSDAPVDLSGWVLRFSDYVIHLGSIEGSTVELRGATIDSKGYFVLERTDDQTIADLDGDIIYRGGLSNRGEDVTLLNAEGEVVDSILCSETGWPAGCASSGTPGYGTMERAAVDGEAIWSTNCGRVQSGTDADGSPLCGTPGSVNEAVVVAASTPQVEWLTPSEEDQDLSGTVVLRWKAQDPDAPADQLRLHIDFSTDSGQTWTALADHLANAGSYAWNTETLENGESYMLRIGARDLEGFVGVAVSEVFRITNP